MTNLNLSDVRIFVCLNPIRMQFSFDTLMGLAQETFNQDPLSGHLFLFFNRKRDRIKIATEGDQGIELNSHQLNQLLDGLDLRNGRRRRRYRRVS